MTKQEIKRALERVSESQGFVTATQFTKVMGQKTVDYMKKKYLNGLECIDGKYYLISDIVTVLWERRTHEAD